MQSSNPAFSDTFVGNLTLSQDRSRVMTVEGTALKAFVLLAAMLLTASISWSMVGDRTLSITALAVSGIAAFVIALVTCFKPTLAPITAPLYAASQGFCLGAISRVFEASYPGIVIQAVALTGGVTFLMLTLYATRLIRVTGQLTSAVIAATGAIALVYLASFVMHLFGMQMPYIHDTGPIGIGFSVFVVGLAAFNLLLDFDFIERASRERLEKSMEWYGAFALMVTLVWMYRQILDLLRKLNDRD